MAYVKLHHDNHICSIKEVISGVGLLPVCAQEEFPENDVNVLFHIHSLYLPIVMSIASGP
jgi:hypothetical protein